MTKSNVVLIGMPGCGKSTVGVVLAKTLGMSFVDTDLIIQQREGRLLQEIIDSDGLLAFLSDEESAILSLQCENSVIATGGSAVFGEKAMKKLRDNGIVVFLDVPCETLKERLGNIKTRGVAAEKGQSVESILRQRLPLYEKYADFTVNAQGSDAEITVEKTVRILKNKI